MGYPANPDTPDDKPADVPHKPLPELSPAAKAALGIVSDDVIVGSVEDDIAVGTVVESVQENPDRHPSWSDPSDVLEHQSPKEGVTIARDPLIPYLETVKVVDGREQLFFENMVGTNGNGYATSSLLDDKIDEVNGRVDMVEGNISENQKELLASLSRGFRKTQMNQDVAMNYIHAKERLHWQVFKLGGMVMVIQTIAIICLCVKAF